ncbi:transmembrane protein [Cystoisospora suis]|uniref:Transmembrane protein n=1 Tax=Cystoisospora suis TaxID=483139 RepID=A0A2C6L069_9APIC|nr:transmembrane protein [Cystoisospora suis]
MNVGTALGLHKVIPGEEDLPSLPKIDTHKKRKQPKKTPSLPQPGGSVRSSRAVSSKNDGRWTRLLWSGEGRKRDSAQPSRLRDDNSLSKDVTGGELGELLAVCQRVENECLVTAKEEQEEEEGDEFLALKKRMYETIRNTQILIEDRRDIRASKGTTLETVRLGGEIDDNIALLRELFEELSAVYGRQFKQRKKRLLTDDDLEERHADINTLMRAIEELRRESKRTAISTRLHDQTNRIRTLTELQSSRETATCWGEAGGEAHGRPEEISEADQAVLRRWKERDEEFDKQVAEIGEAIDRIAHVAVQVGEKAEVHHEMIQNLQKHTDEAAAEIQNLNAKVKTFLGKQSNGTFFTRLILIVILLFLICFVISTIYSRYIKKA